MEVSEQAEMTEAEIWRRVVSSNNSTWSSEVAQSVLEFNLPDRDIERMNELARKAQSGTLTAAERDEAETYDRVGLLLELMHSKARMSRRASNG